MNTPVTPTGETTLQKEQHLFNELFNRLVDALLNRIFDLRPEKAVRRMGYLTILLFASGFLISLYYYPLGLWMLRIQDIFSFLFRSSYVPNYEGNPFTNIIRFGIDVFGDARVLQYLPIFLAPFFIALQSAAIYLADVFELEDVRVARSFIWEVSLTGSDETIRIMHGDIADQHRTSSNYLIGGPGKVIVDLDSVALFEKPDGTPRIIGPTVKEPGGKATLDGFERLRQAIDLRDHFIELRDQDSKSFSVQSRSLDGIPITATDVRFMFSVYRDGQKSTTENPYPFSREAIEQIIYKATSRVTPDLANPSTYEFSWINNMIGLIRGRLGGFMNEHNLSIYLASIGMPEVEKVKQREQTIVEQMQQLTQSGEDASESKEIKPPPEFQPRYKITNLFAQFAKEFTEKARNSGVELHWIGVGTWKTPIELVPEKHLEAWKLAQENLKNDSKDAMKKAESEAIINKMESLINGVPLDAYHDIIGTSKQTKKSAKKQEKKQKDEEESEDDVILDADELVEEINEMAKFIKISRMINEKKSSVSDNKDTDHKDAIRLLLLEYRKQFIETAEFIKAKNEIVPQNIEDAVKHIETQLGIKHWAGIS